jgi:hypothetical protein
MGVIDLGLTPDFLDSPQNIQTAHKKSCNRKTELALDQCLIRLKTVFGITDIPNYLKGEVKKLWETINT